MLCMGSGQLTRIDAATIPLLLSGLATLVRIGIGLGDLGLRLGVLGLGSFGLDLTHDLGLGLSGRLGLGLVLHVLEQILGDIDHRILNIALIDGVLEGVIDRLDRELVILIGENDQQLRIGIEPDAFGQKRGRKQLSNIVFEILFVKKCFQALFHLFRPT